MRSDIGKRYGKLTVVGEFLKGKEVYCNCVCDCGTTKDVHRGNLRSGRTKSCGCSTRQFQSEANKKKNAYFRRGYDTVVGIATNTGNKFLIDADDYDKVKTLTWYETNNGYIVNKAGNGATLLHRLITGAKEGEVVDHKNHNKLDNRKINLHVGSQSDNMRNLNTPPTGITKKKDGTNVYFIVELNGKYRGCFKSYNEARYVRDKVIDEEYPEWSPAKRTIYL